MAMSFTRPDPGNPAQIAEATFSTTRRGFDQAEVRDFLQMVAAEMSRLGERVRFLEREVDAAQTSPEVSARLDEDTLTRLLGEETARVLSAARVGAAEIREKAEHAAAQLVSEASDEAARIREEVEVEASRRRADAAADSEAELEMAKQQGREMVNEARAYRERVLSELSRRRELAREQIEQLVHGRDRLVAAFERARTAAVDVISDLEPLGEPDEYVNLAPTTGPVPVMVARDDQPAPESDVDGKDTTEGETAEVIEIDAAAEVDTEPPTSADEAEQTDDERADAEQAPDDGVVDTDDADPGASDSVPDTDGAGGAAAEDAGGDVVVDLFARLRSETDATDADPSDADADPTDATDAPADDVESTDATETDPAEDTADAADESADTQAAQDQATEDTVEIDDESDADHVADPADEPFEQRDAELTPLIVAAARKLKRVLADEQNDVLDALRTANAVTGLDDLVPVEPEQAGRYVDAISDDLLVAAQAGASSTRADGVVTLTRKHARSSVDLAGDQLAGRLIALLRGRLERSIADTDGDLTALTKKVRAVYREVKTRHIDDVLDDVFRTAYGAGQFAAIPAEESIVWICDQRHPCGADCEDNALSRPIPHGEPFPTGHTSPPAHPGCRCLLQIAPR